MKGLNFLFSLRNRALEQSSPFIFLSLENEVSGSKNPLNYTYYILDAQGNQISAYEHKVNDQNVSYELTERNIYGSNHLGTLNAVVDMYAGSQEQNVSNILGEKYYSASEHRSNVLTVYSDLKIPLSSNGTTVDAYQVYIVNISDYSGFGVELDGRTIKNGNYRRSFQGQESDDEIKGEGNSINYKYRMHDPRVGRFFAVDPLAAEYPWNSPYAFSENIVINAVELEGLERAYTFNSLKKSSEAKIMMKSSSYKELKAYMDKLVGAKFNSVEELNQAKDMLGSQFDGGAGYASNSEIPLSSGNREVKGSYESSNSTANYFTVRLVIDNGNGSWGIEEYKIINNQPQIDALDNEIKEIDRNISKFREEITWRSKSVESNRQSLKSSGTGNFYISEPKGKVKQDRGDYIAYAANLARSELTHNPAITELEGKIKIYEKKKSELIKKRDSIKPIKIEKLK